MDRFKKTLLKLFSIAYRSRCSIPIIISTACMLLGFKFRLDFQLEAQPVEEEEEEEYETEDSDQESEDGTNNQSIPVN